LYCQASLFSNVIFRRYRNAPINILNTYAHKQNNCQSYLEWLLQSSFIETIVHHYIHFFAQIFP